MFNYSVSWQFILYFMSMWEESINYSVYKETEVIYFGREIQICIREREQIPNKAQANTLVSVAAQMCSLLQWK